ncbi:MAG: hypothetical protein IPP40_06890 [bacterium]|nr:hypothetical protein [bacterium]
MGKKTTSALHDLFVALRRVIVLVIAAFGLAMGWRLPVVGARVLVLWGMLVILSNAAEILFQYLSHRALIQQSMQGGTDTSGGAARS